MQGGEIRVLCGDEPYLIENRLKQIIEEIRNQIGEEPECVFKDGDELGEDELFDLLHFAPLFGYVRVLVLHRLPCLVSGGPKRSRKPSNVEQILLQYVGAPNPLQVLILITPSLPTESELAKLLKKQKMVEEIKRLNKRELQSWVKSEFAQRGVEPEDKLVEEIAGSGWDMSALENQVEKLCLASEKRRLSTAEAQELLDLREDVKIFALSDALLNRDLAAAYGTVSRLFAQGEPPGLILYTLTKQFLLMAEAKALKQQGTTASEITDVLNLKHGFVAKKLLQAAEKFGWREIEAVFNYLLETDKALKGSGASNEKMLFEVLAAEICKV
ncbi:MAG TPA: DNA polymerase III subunit delta [Syntrophothermus lipocalidus]|uniref:DNA polymerase III subunit delta n=1 Tax=Syntrophothermus sp. TaxID=2736299 RepID=UPI0018391314|nr:DNA polymerase III subunit delta [Syntrophothermus sp.]NSW83288.1 DNA polymerase III subunit delta [Syntrophothermus sp.]HHV77758.1 DNA polymerase III subunit delta [Syntrophothermus lipocalidus]